MNAAAVPASLLDLYRSEWRADPYALYRRLRERGNVHWDALMGSWIVLGYTQIGALGRNPNLSEDRITSMVGRLLPAQRRALAPLSQALSDMMLFNDAPRHASLRGIFRETFSRKSIDGLRAPVERYVAHLVKSNATQGEIEIVKDLAEPLAMNVVADLLGISAADRPQLRAWQSLMHVFFTRDVAELARVERIRSIFREILHGGELAPGSPIEAMRQSAQSGSLSEAELFANFLLIIDAGQVTTSHLIANAVLALVRNPEQLASLRETPGLLPRAVQELLRFDSSVQFTTRIARAAFLFEGHHIEAGQAVTFVLGAANRDPARYAEPDRLDLTRSARDHLSFGFGPHFCLGASLAQLEIEAVLRYLLDHTTVMALADAPLQWEESINFRFLKSLRLQADFAAG